MIVLDVEASGTNYAQHSILALGALDFNDPENRFYLECQAWEGAKLEDEALAITGFSREQATDDLKQTEAQLIAQFLSWADGVEDQTFAGQNVSFDRDFVKAACERAGYNYPFAQRTLDTHSFAYMHFVLHGFSVPIEKRHTGLDIPTILDYLGLPGEPRPHNALTGALLHAEMIARLVFNKPLLPEFSNYPLRAYEK